MTERIGSVAALETLNEMERLSHGNNYKKVKKYKKMEQIAKSNNLKISVLGIPAILIFNYFKDWLKYKYCNSKSKKKMYVLMHFLCPLNMKKKY